MCDGNIVISTEAPVLAFASPHSAVRRMAKPKSTGAELSNLFLRNTPFFAFSYYV